MFSNVHDNEPFIRIKTHRNRIKYIGRRSRGLCVLYAGKLYTYIYANSHGANVETLLPNKKQGNFLIYENDYYIDLK